MGVTDIITLISLLIALIAIISEKNRKHLLLKFQWTDYILLTIGFLLINYFVFYQKFYTHGLVLQCLYFESFGLSNPKDYAYLFTVVLLVFIAYKILFSFYPMYQQGKVLRYYQQLIENNDSSFLMDLIERYHKKDIISLVQESPDESNDQKDFFVRRFKKISFKERLSTQRKLLVRTLFPSSKLNRYGYAGGVLNGIINDPAFVEITANQRPYFFPDIFHVFTKKKRGSFPSELVNSYFRELLKHRNFWLRKEIKKSEDNDYGQPEWFFDENRILSSVLFDLSVADENEIWQSFGDEAVREIQNEKLLGYNSKMFNPHRDTEDLRIFITHDAIQFFKILIVEAIKKDIDDCHFWLHYYAIIVDTILETYEQFPPKDIDNDNSILNQFIDEIISNIFLWLRILNEKNKRIFLINILMSFGNMVDSLTKSLHYSEKNKIQLLDRVLSYYCNLHENESTQAFREKLEDLLLKPCNLTKDGDQYYTIVAKAWSKFDKIPHRGLRSDGTSDYDYFQQLKTKVIIPLGLDPNIY